MIKEYYLKDGSKRFQFHIYLGIDPLTGKEVRTTRRGFKTRKDAKLTIARLKLQFDGGDYGKTVKRMTFKDVFELWLPSYESTVKESTFQVQNDVIRLHILPTFGDLFVDKLTTAYCQEQVNKWYGYYAKYPNLIGLTQRILEFARLNLKVINSNPMRDVIRPKKQRKLKEDIYEAPYYDAEQLKHFMNCVEQMDFQTHVTFRIIAYTGMRQGEVCGLRWSDFDEINQSLAVKRTVSRGKDYKKVIQSTKTASSERIIPIDDVTAALLREWKQEQRRVMFALGFNTNSKDQYIITNETNDFQYSQYPYTRLKRIRKLFDIDEITVHGLRHTHCTLLLEAGISLKEVQDRMGHEDTDMVLEVYSHINKKSKPKIGNAFADFVAL